MVGDLLRLVRYVFGISCSSTLIVRADELRNKEPLLNQEILLCALEPHRFLESV